MSDPAYIERLQGHPSALLLELEQHGRADGIPIVDRATGRFLSVLVHAMQAHRILEIGTAYGYSTLWMALAMPPAGHIWTIDPDMERTEIARTFLDRAGVGSAVEIVNQPALEILRNAPYRNLDIVFVDGLKSEYEAYVEAAVPLLKRSGLIVVDNCLWGGRAAAAPRPDDDADTRAIRAFNAAFMDHPALETTIVRIGDGVGIGALRG